MLLGSALGYEVHVNRKQKDYTAVERTNGGEYEATVYLGTPSQEIEHMVLDTGSFLPWVKNKNFY